jgi:ribose/xylose/arabinose/galactoside ABC-type transport system permease subunit
MATAARPAGAHQGFVAGLRRIFGSQEMVLLLSLIALLVVVGAINPRYLAERNLQSMFLGNAYIAVAAIGMSMVIISGNIDISVGSLIGVLATLSGTLAVSGFPIIVCWLAPLVAGAMVTALMGFLVAYLRIPAIVVTLGMLSILKGGLISVTAGAWITDLPEGYALAQMRPLNVPMPVWFMVVLTALAALWMRYSGTGRAIYAVGGNAEAARLSGISRRRTIMTVFTIHGVFVGIASVLFATQLSVIQSTVPPNLELTIITASVVGGVSILGGTGTVIGSTLAAILLAAIGSSLIFVNLSPYWLRAVQGVLILATVLADLMRRRRQARG